MKIAETIVRVLMALLFIVSVINYFFPWMPRPELGANAMSFVTGLGASGYLMPTVKIIELICSIAFLTNRFVPLAAVVIFPISLNILLFHAFLAPQSLVMQVFIFAGNLFLAYVHRKNYEGVFALK